ncbi:Acyl-coenzyme A synthetase/AMP-(fatty) acid ligase [Halanaeroarchaeum sp. HSR-CO]|uniref:AMP-binding protein n=1 Tax=Halanaeroarchaeum sp. HSR-CO TaxID=2866382 RepID=UPI00217D2132|nr:AMP-binding protein [Halanaeroarchaeum sp. HSR-CO]UWG47394.1 Acyl-coenzyme A synthetase/AMP-(fatty) acid ligase [Halanaeroarchaeum sp. HSR-CO]
MDSFADVDEVVHEPDRSFVESTNVWSFMQAQGIEDYDDLVSKASEDIEWFWDEVVQYLGLEFYDDYDAVRVDAEGPQFTDWYVGGTLNVAHNVVDRHAHVDAGTRNHVATIWEGEPGEVREMTYHDLHEAANRVANALEHRGVGRGDTVALYMPMVPEVVSILYGIFSVGAIAVPIFSGFGTDAVATRLDESGADVLFTADGFYRRGSEVPLKRTADAAVEGVGGLEHVIVYDRLGSNDATGKYAIPWDWDRDEWWENAIGGADGDHETAVMDASDPAMLLYSSGTTGRPKGIVHTHAGSLVQPAKEIYFGFDHKPFDRFFWVSDIGWMMGPWSLIGNHAFGGTVLMYEGAPDHPAPDRFWELIDDHGVTTFGISPTAIRALRKEGDEWLEGHDLSSIRILGSTGEPWDPESWRWFYDEVGGGSAPIINITGGTEILGCFLMPSPVQSLKPTTVGSPGLGMDVDIVDEHGESIAGEHEQGYLVARDSCPSMTRSLWEGDERYLDAYWSRWDDLWNHGDWAQIDEDGYWFLLGRADDAITVAGRKVGPAEVEGALIDHEAVNQAAVVGVPDETTGEAAVAYVILEPEVDPSDHLESALAEHVGAKLGKPFRPREIHFVEAFPKTQSGKIVRRIIASAYTGEAIGDTSSIENPEAIDRLRDV